MSFDERFSAWRAVLVDVLARSGRTDSIWIEPVAPRFFGSFDRPVGRSAWSLPGVVAKGGESSLRSLSLSLLPCCFVLGCGGTVGVPLTAPHTSGLVQASGASQVQGSLENAVIVGRSTAFVISEDKSKEIQNHSGFMP